MKKIYVLKKDLPNCPRGRIFKPTYNGKNYYHYMTDEEFIYHEKQLKHYKFTKDEILNNEKEWFTDFYQKISINPHKISDEVISLLTSTVDVFNYEYDKISNFLTTKNNFLNDIPKKLLESNKKLDDYKKLLYKIDYGIYV